MTNLPTKDPLFIRKLKAILETHLENEHFGVSELAKEAGLSRSSLHRKVHAYNGNSTSQFIREIRLQKAMELLQEGEETVSEIAYRVGFSSPTYFNTCFKEYFGYPPGEAKLRDVSSAQDTGTANNPYPLVRTKDRITYLNKRLKRTKRWTIVLIIGIAISVAWATSYYINNNADKSVPNYGEVNEINSIAVLPFKNWSGDPDLEYISDGMTDAIITRLNLIQDLKVTPFTSVLKYKYIDHDAQTIAKELGVQNILYGNWQLSGNQVKITLHLIDGISNANNWSQVYNGKWKTDEIFDMQASVAEAVADELSIDLSEITLVSIRKNPTTNKEAYDLWLKGNYQMNKFNKKGFMSALKLYENALALDSNFLEAHIGTAYIYLFGGASWGLFNEQKAWVKAKHHLFQALELDSTNINAKRGLNDGLYLYEWDFNNMEKNYQEYSNISWIYCLQSGRFEELLALLDKSFEKNNNPVESIFPVMKSQALFHLNRNEEAIEILKRSDPIFDDDIMYLRLASSYYYYMGEFDKSKEMLTKLLYKFPDRPPLVLWLCAVHARRDGQLEQERAFLEELLKRFEAKESGSPAWYTALYYSSVGDVENAFLWLNKSFNRHEVEMIWLREQPMLKPLRTDPRYLELYHKVGFPMPPHPN